MSPRPRPLRRRLLLALGRLMAGGVAMGVVTAWRPERAAADLPAGLRGLFRDPRAATLIGRRILHAAPGLAGNPPPCPGGHDDDAGRRRQHLSGEIRADFAAGRIVCIDGWFLAETEARLCALMARADGHHGP